MSSPEDQSSDDDKLISLPQDLIKDIPEEKRAEFIRQYFLYVEARLLGTPAPLPVDRPT